MATELLEIEGIYRDGKVELSEVPDGVQEARVRVVFLPDEEQQRKARREAGKRLIARLKEGIPFGGSPYPKREELYDRVTRYDKRDG
jgi:hypothetical protein